MGFSPLHRRRLTSWRGGRGGAAGWRRHDRSEPSPPDSAADEADGDRCRPPASPSTAQTWKEIAHLLANLPMALIGFVYVVTVLVTGAGLSVTVVGLPLLAAGLRGCRLLGRLERARARALLGVRIDEPSPLPLRRAGGFFRGCGWR